MKAFHEFYQIVKAVHKQGENGNDEKTSLNSHVQYELGGEAEIVGKIECDTSDSLSKHETNSFQNESDMEELGFKSDSSVDATISRIEERPTNLNTSSTTIEAVGSYDASNERKENEKFDIKSTSSSVQVSKSPTKTRNSNERTIDEIV